MAAPLWLEARFPKREWNSLRKCCLQVDPVDGAGFDLEETDMGQRVDAIYTSPGQDPLLKVGDTIVGIDGHCLIGLPDSTVGEVFGNHFVHGVEIVVVSTDELQEARIERDANEECPCEFPDDEDAKPEDSANYELLRRTKSSSEYDAKVRIPVGRAMVWRVDEATRGLLEGDISILGKRFGVNARVEVTEQGDVKEIVLEGLSTAIASARPEVTQLLKFYRDGGQSAQNTLAEREDNLTREVEVETNRVQTLADGVPEHVKDIGQFQYHDHTADIIVHSWGQSRAEAFAQVCVGMFQYMTELDKIEMCSSVDVEATGHDMLDLLYHFLDEFLFVFGSEFHISRCIEILDFDEEKLRIRARGYGERMDLEKHEQGTEIKAVTMHMMKILGPETVLTETGTFARLETGDEVREGFPHEAYVLLDI